MTGTLDSLSQDETKHRWDRKDVGMGAGCKTRLNIVVVLSNETNEDRSCLNGRSGRQGKRMKEYEGTHASSNKPTWNTACSDTSFQSLT